MRVQGSRRDSSRASRGAREYPSEKEGGVLPARERVTAIATEPAVTQAVVAGLQSMPNPPDALMRGEGRRQRATPRPSSRPTRYGQEAAADATRARALEAEVTPRRGSIAPATLRTSRR